MINDKIKIENHDGLIIIKDHFNDSTFQKVSNFYDKEPFPNYRKDENLYSILEKGDKNFLAKEFKKFMKFNKSFLEVGCGTGQLSNYFAIGTNHKVYALDSAFNSLILGKKFSQANSIKNINFIQGDLTKKIFKSNSFDFIWCNGVLHHTKNAELGFQNICHTLKPGGYVLIGLYNKFGRVRTVIRQKIYKYISKKLAIFLDPFLRKLKKDKEVNNKDKILSWIQDQYEHPVETLHTFDETLSWFKKNNIEFISSIPQTDISEINNIFEKKSSGNFYLRTISQLVMIFTNHGAEGGLFIFIGKKLD